MHADFFLLTSLAFPYIKTFIIVPVLKFLVHMEEKKKKPAMANLFFHLFYWYQIRKNAELS